MALGVDARGLKRGGQLLAPSLFTVGMLDSRGSTGTQTFRLVVEKAQPTAKTKKKKTTRR